MPHCAPRAATAGSDAHAATLPVLDFSIAESLRAALVHSRYSRAHPAMPCPHPVTPSRLSRRVNNRSLPKSSACNTTEKQSGGEETASRRAHSALRRALSSSAACSAAAMSGHRVAGPPCDPSLRLPQSAVVVPIDDNFAQRCCVLPMPPARESRKTFRCAGWFRSRALRAAWPIM
jgi:hypothetical protein